MSRQHFADRVMARLTHGQCEHSVLVATTLPLTGRCLECGALVDTPFTLHASRKDV